MKNKKIRVILLLVAILFLIAVLPPKVKAAQMSSSNYQIYSSVISSGGRNITSSNYQTNFVLGTIAKDIISAAYKLFLGFWYTITAEINLAPSAPVLLLPENNTAITNRTPTFTWNNSIDPESQTLTYQILVDNDTNFNSPEINQSSISETTTNTSYTSAIELEVDKVYWWKVRANDSANYGNWSTTFNFTLESYKAISAIRNIVNFSTMNNNEVNDTTDNNPWPFLVENSGNIFVNITVTGTQLFTQGGFPSRNFQFKIGENETGSYNTALSTTSWTNVTNVSSANDVVNLDWHDSYDTFETDLNVSVPADEGGGAKSSTITFSS